VKGSSGTTDELLAAPEVVEGSTLVLGQLALLHAAVVILQVRQG